MEKEIKINNENKKNNKFVKPVAEIIKINDELIITTSCLAKGTKILLANGLTKNIEDLNENDVVLTFNHEKGCYVESEILYIFRCNAPKCSFTLSFEDGTELSIVREHDLFEKESLKYVTITDKNANEYIGKHFYSVTNKSYIELKNVTFNQEPVEYYEIYTKNSLNCVANGMLNVADDVDAFLNIYEFNEDLTVNFEKLANDVKEFGYFEYTDEYSIKPEEFEAWNMHYVNIVVGKKLSTMEELVNQRITYVNEQNVAKLTKLNTVENNIEKSL